MIVIIHHQKNYSISDYLEIEFSETYACYDAQERSPTMSFASIVTKSFVCHGNATHAVITRQETALLQRYHKCIQQHQTKHHHLQQRQQN